MTQYGAKIPLEPDAPEPAHNYEQAVIARFQHGKPPIGPLALKVDERALDTVAGPRRLAKFVNDALQGRGDTARLRQSKRLTFAAVLPFARKGCSSTPAERFQA